ncbi:4-hydroxy-tetrahydrodipicolinate synthase [Hoeflea sp.]|uniref:4-hydroxy-tetrahydrodipicolinate synthase n=1 Tax=Hoeflea sp. TaxID=1940281 RepID=UPI00198B5EB2|nr:4-hydroxy-tetrahydrodipicolinate synthase [Hoeflea sp.]MBC7282700.1 4-hydroxy-tetrahydrodipicolinate synthase [Hoeflea sp.]
MFKGSIPALITPFTENGAVDEDGFASHVERMIKAGSHGLVPVGTTGESPTLTHAEHKRVVELCVEVTAGRVPVIAGAGSNNTAESIELAVHAENAGADALLVVTPYYNKPTQKGLYQHFKAVAEASKLPIIIYNIPPRSVVDMSVETMAALARDFSNIIGVKDATGNLARVPEQRMACGKDFVQLSGEDPTALGFNAHGGVGCISVSANVAPRECAAFQEATLRGDYATALTMLDRLMPLHKAIFTEPGVAGVKYCLGKMGLINNVVRSPLTAIEPGTAALLDKAMAHAGVIG